MTTNEQDSRGSAVAHADQPGKVFVALRDGMRRCLVCDGAFTRQSASEHANVPCWSSDRE
jgi:hypothetical protein